MLAPFSKVPVLACSPVSKLAGTCVAQLPNETGRMPGSARDGLTEAPGPASVTGEAWQILHGQGLPPSAWSEPAELVGHRFS